MEIRAYSAADYDDWCHLFVSYFGELGVQVAEEVVRSSVCPLIAGQVTAGIVRMDLCVEGGQPIGFSIYQVDHPESDWCKKEGWGCIREFFILPAYRRRGFGRRLAAHTEAQLAQMGATCIYLTRTDALVFWTSCGYRVDVKDEEGTYWMTKHYDLYSVIGGARP